ncbi:hypothetical protein NDU88_004352, partial [Pleurodeles waltl]
GKAFACAKTCMFAIKIKKILVTPVWCSTHDLAIMGCASVSGRLDLKYVFI